MMHLLEKVHFKTNKQTILNMKSDIYFDFVCCTDHLRNTFLKCDIFCVGLFVIERYAGDKEVQIFTL